MSGELDIPIRIGAMFVNKLVEYSKKAKINYRKKKLVKKVKEVENDLDRITELKDEIEELMNGNDDFSLTTIKKQKLDELEEIKREYNDDDEIYEMFDNVINVINSASGITDIIDAFYEFKTELNVFLFKRELDEDTLENALEQFEVEKDGEFIDEEKKLFTIFLLLEKIGYSPIYDKTRKTIIVEKENGDQILSYIYEDSLKMEFNDYMGKTCATDMAKIDYELKKIGLLEKDTQIYTHWYKKEIKVKNKEKYSEFKERREKLLKKTKKVGFEKKNK